MPGRRDERTGVTFVDKSVHDLRERAERRRAHASALTGGAGRMRQGV